MTSTAWRTAGVVAVSLVSAPAAATAGFVAVVLRTGCFLSCEQPDGVVGGLLGLLAVGLLAAGPGLGWLLLRGRGVAQGLGGLLLGVVLSAALLA